MRENHGPGRDEAPPPGGGQGNVLARTGDLCHLAVESIEDFAITTLDTEGRFNGWNAGAERITGFSAEEALGQHFSLIFTPEDRENGEPERELDEARAEGRAVDERWHLSKDGTRFWGSGVTMALVDDRGQVVGFTKIVRDLTEQRRRDVELRLLGSAIENANDVIVITEAEPLSEPGPRIVYLNPAFTRMTGYRPEEVLGKSPRLLQGPDTDREATSRIRKALERREPVRVELVNYRKDGEPFWVEVSIVPVFDDAGHLTHWASVQRETTARREAEETARRLAGEEAAREEAAAGRLRAEEILAERDRAAQALRESNETLAAVIRASPLALKVLDAEGRVEIWNPAAEKIFGWSEEEVRGQEMPNIPAEKEEEARWIRETALQGRTITGLETYRVRKDGSRVDVELSTAPLYDVEGRVRGTMVELNDISERKRAKAALQETAERLQALVASAPIAVTTLDMEGRVEFWNPAAERMFGWTAEEVRGEVIPIVPEDRINELHGELAAASRGEEVVGFETERLRKDGSRLAVRVSTAPLRNAAGEVKGMMSLVEDISERKRAVAEQQRLSAILEATPDFVSTSDPEGHYIYLNRAAKQMLGIGADEDVSGLDLAAIYPNPELLKVLREAIPAAIREGSWSGESAIKSRVGREIPTSQVIIAHRGKGGEIEFLSTVARDITELKRREEALGFLAEASERLTATLDYEAALRDLAGLLVPRLADYCIIDVVEAGEARRVAVVHRDPDREEIMSRLSKLGPSQEAPVGARAVIESGEPELVPHVTAAWIRAATRDEEHLRVVRDLAPRSIMVVPLLARGHIFGAITLAATEPGRHYGIDDLELAEEFARRAALAVDNARLFRESVQAARIRDQVLRIVAHDLRNPLNTIGLSAGLLLETMPEEMEGERRQLEIIQHSITRADTLIQDLLDMARAEARTLVIEAERVETMPLLDEVLALHRIQAEEKGLRLVAEIPEELPPIAADRDRIHQLFSNLIGNAIKFTEEGTVTVGAAASGDVVRFWVRDTGLGIPEEWLPNLFDPFWQVSRAERAGTGLGLAISKAIVEAHGGTIEVESEVGVGTTFSFSIPVATEGEVPE